MKKSIFLLIAMVFTLAISPLVVFAEEAEAVTEISAEAAGVSATAANTAEAEATTVEEETGMLIEIGNTTAEETTIIIRTEEDGATTDQTVQIANDTAIVSDDGSTADLSNWIAGDQITYTAAVGDNSGEIRATKLRNRSFKVRHAGKNGWVKAIDEDTQTMDVEWANQVFTLDMREARMVAGLMNPASLADFQVGDRIRARVTDDGDQNPTTWKAVIVVVLRRGEALFMRVTRWVVPAEIVSIPEDTTVPYIITAKVLESKFYEAGDVNNLIGAPGTEFSIQVDENTKLVRRYLGKAVIDEFMEGDQIRVIGRLNEETGNLDAKIIKNNSIQRLGVSSRISEVISVDTSANTMVVKPIGVKDLLTGRRRRITNGQEWTLELDSETKIFKNGEEIRLSDIAVGDIVRVRGTANLLRKTVDTSAIAVVTIRFKTVLESAEQQ